VEISGVDHSGRAVEGMNRLHPLERWGRWFESTQGMDVCVRLKHFF
jgi:hypothetical protein